MPLATLPAAKRDHAFVGIANSVVDAMEVNAIGNSLRLIDEFTAQADAFVHDKPFPERAGYRIMASQKRGSVSIGDGKITYEEIVASDIDKLDSGSRQLIRTYERSMEDLFDRWTDLEPKRHSRDFGIREKTKKAMKETLDDLCETLRKILLFLQSMGKSLIDHYNHIRFICEFREQGT